MMEPENKWTFDFDNDYTANYMDAERKKLIDEVQKMIRYNASKVDRTAKKYDVSSDLTDDALAKLNLVHGDCVVIPLDKIREFYEDCK